MLWYMISAIYALGIIYLLLKIKVNPWAITALGLVFILCGAALDMLSGTTNDISPAINFIRKLMWATTGNGKVFRGLFYISFGMLLTKIKIPIVTSSNSNDATDSCRGSAASPGAWRSTNIPDFLLFSAPSDFSE